MRLLDLCARVRAVAYRFNSTSRFDKTQVWEARGVVRFVEEHDQPYAFTAASSFLMGSRRFLISSGM